MILVYKNDSSGKNAGQIFNTTDPLSNKAWNLPGGYYFSSVDPYNDGTSYMATAGTNLYTVDIEIGFLSQLRRILNGSIGFILTYL